MSSFKEFLQHAVGKGLNVLNPIFPSLVGRICIWLFRSPREGKLAPIYESYLKKCDERKTLNTEAGKIPTYLWNPNGKKTVLLIHGWESNSARWKLLIPKLLKQGLRIVSIDAPAHGASDLALFDIEKYAEFIQEAILHFRPHYLVAHSVGGATAVYHHVHFDFPPYEKLVLLGTPSLLTNMMDLLVRTLRLSPNATKSMYQYFEKKFKRSVYYHEGERFSESIKIPVLLVHDKEDDVIPYQDSERMHAALEQGELILTKGLDHSMQDEKVFDRIFSFLAD